MTIDAFVLLLLISCSSSTVLRCDTGDHASALSIPNNLPATSSADHKTAVIDAITPGVILYIFTMSAPFDILHQASTFTMSPLPSGPFTLHGGCDCTAVRYTISVPAQTSEETRFPTIVLDHCNKCRRVSGALVQAWLTSPQSWLEWSVGSTGPLPSEEKVRTWFTMSTKEVLKSVPGACPVANYASSPGVTRTFCGRCGTNLAYYYAGNGDMEGQPMIDVVLGSLDTESLEMEGIRPDRHLYWESGITWVKDVLAEGDKSLSLGEEKLPRHPAGSKLETC